MAGLICLRLPLILSIIGFTNQVGKLQMIWSDQKEPTARVRHCVLPITVLLISAYVQEFPWALLWGSINCV